MTARAGEPLVLNDLAMERMHGTPKARVLPEPVSATPITSRPERRKGQAADCIGVGVWKVLKAAEDEAVEEGRWENCIIGRRLVEKFGSLVVMKLVERKSSISD